MMHTLLFKGDIVKRREFAKMLIFSKFSPFFIAIYKKFGGVLPPGINHENVQHVHQIAHG